MSSSGWAGILNARYLMAQEPPDAPGAEEEPADGDETNDPRAASPPDRAE